MLPDQFRPASALAGRVWAWRGAFGRCIFHGQYAELSVQIVIRFAAGQRLQLLPRLLRFWREFLDLLFHRITLSKAVGGDPSKILPHQGKAVPTSARRFLRPAEGC